MNGNTLWARRGLSDWPPAPTRRPRHHLAHRRLVSRGTTASASRSLYKSDFKKRG